MVQGSGTSATEMARALLTDGERRALWDDEMDPNTRSTHLSRVKKKLGDRLEEDVAFLREHRPELYELLHESVCEDQLDERVERLENEVERLREELEN